MIPRPTHAHTIRAIEISHPTDEDEDLLAALRYVEDLHVPSADQPDDRGYWGRCVGCRERWPCPPWVHAEKVGIEWLGRACDRVWAHARSVIVELRGRAA